MIYKYLQTNDSGVKIYARIDEDGKCRVTCTEDNPEFVEWCKTNTPEEQA